MKDAHSSPLTTWLLLGLLVSTPLIVLPFFDNFMVASKTMVLFFGTLIVVSDYFIRAAKSRTLRLTLSPLLIPLIGFCGAISLSTFLAPNYPVQSMLGMGGIYLAMATIAILGGSLASKKSAPLAISALSVLGMATAVTSLAQVLGFGVFALIDKVTPLTLGNDTYLNLIGSPFLAAQVLFVVGVVVGWDSWKRKKITLISGATLISVLVGLVVTIWMSLPGKPSTPLLVPFGANWSIALDVIRSPRGALIGVGTEHFGLAYNQFKPAWINNQPWWQVRFLQGSNVPLTLLVTSGFLGLASWLALAALSVRAAARASLDSAGLAAGVVAIFGLQLIFPTNVVMLTLLGGLFAFWIASERRHEAHLHTFALTLIDSSETSPKKSHHPKTISLVLALVGIALVGLTAWWLVRAFMASHAFYRSIVAAQNNDAASVYENQQQAIQLNPYVAGYRRQYAITNIQIANAISATAQERELTSEEASQVSELVQQAIRESRAATLLVPQDVDNWVVLGDIYSQLIGVAEDAEQWAVNAYVQAISAEPTNPNLRIQLGGLFYQAKQFEQALSLFQQAIDLKPDMPNAYYNTANALKEIGRYDQSVLAYQQTLLLLDPNSESYQQAAQELTEVEKLVPAKPTQQTTGSAGSQQQTDQTNEINQVPSILDQTVSQPEAEIVQPPLDQPLNQPSEQLPTEETTP